MTENRKLQKLNTVPGLHAFNQGQFYEAHELWEEVWNEIDDPERLWVQGLIQIATGLHKLSRGRSDICAKLLHKALGKLEGSPEAALGLDLAHARAEAARILAAISRGELPDARSVRMRASETP
jgi:predicted metal-dependent hydrolase